MIIIEQSDGIVIKRTIDTANSVRIDKDGGIAFWGQPTPPYDGMRVGFRKAAKPFCEFDINECRDLLADLDKMLAAMARIEKDGHSVASHYRRVG